MPRTIYLSRLIGVFLLVLATAEASQGSVFAASMIALAGSPALLLLSGMLTLLAGLAIVLAHNVWRGGALAVVVTVFGWLLLIKGAALVVVPAGRWGDMVAASRFADLHAWYGIVPLLLGAYLAFAGFGAGRMPQR
jgi:hypothetical protein